VVAFIFRPHGTSRAILTSQGRNLTIMILPNYVIVTSKTLCSLHGAWNRMQPISSNNSYSTRSDSRHNSFDIGV